MRKSLFILITGYGLLVTSYALADTIYTKDNKEMKGIVLQDYKDRIVLATVDGETTLMKADIKELYYDSEEQNLIRLAEQARDKGDYIKSFVYYDKAFKINPDSEAAKNGIVFLQGYLFKKDMAQKEEVVRRRNDFEQFGAKPENVVKSDEEKAKEDAAKLKNTVGIVLRSKGNVTEIASVAPGTPAQEAGIREGDILVAVWGRLVGYMTLKEAVETLLEKTSLETKCTIARNVDVRINENRNFLSSVNDLIGITLTMKLDGLTVTNIKEGSPAGEAGLKDGDLIVEISGESTRYMSLKRAMELIKKSKGDTVKLTVQREMVMWGKEGG